MDSSGQQKQLGPNQLHVDCSQHFVSGSKSDNALSPNYVPSIFPFVKSPVKKKAANDMKLYERKSAVKQKRLLAADQGTSQTLTPDLQHLDHPGSHSDNEDHGDTTPSLDLDLTECDEPEHPLPNENHCLKEDVECGKVELLRRKPAPEEESCHFLMHPLTTLTRKFVFFTGLPSYDILMAIFSHMSKYLSTGHTVPVGI